MNVLLFDTSFFNGQDFSIILWGIVINVVLGVLVSLLKGNFNFHHLSNFLTGMVLPYILVYAALKVVAGQVSFGILITQVAYVFVVLTLLAGVWEKLGHFGLPSPRWLVRGEK